MTVSMLRAILAVCAITASVHAGDAPLEVMEPSKATESTPRKPERSRWSWNQAPAEVVPTGDLRWKPEAFKLELGKVLHYIDYDAGDDDAAGTKDKPWKHHPWDPAAGGKAKGASGPATYVFRRGVVYRGELRPSPGAGGTDAEPVRLTSDPAWGTGEAEIDGSELVGGWKRGADRADIPDADKVWWADVGFLPRSVWVRRGEAIERVELARSPNWKISDPDDVRSEWWTFQMPNWWENNCGKWKIDFKGTAQGNRAYDGVDAAHLTGKAEDYVGAIAHVEYGWMMGTPFPTKVEGFDAQNKGIIFQGIWWGDSENVVGGCHYYLEDKPNFLDSAGEFWFDRGNGRLYLRLPGDQDPNTARVEVAKRVNLIESSGLAHVDVSGLSFRFTNSTWDYEVPPWMDLDVNNACIRVIGGAEDLRITNCRFDHCAKAVLIYTEGYGAQHPAGPAGRMIIADNDIDQTDHGAIDIRNQSQGDVRILRNHLHLIGLRNFRQDHSHALVVHGAETSEIAGNVLERTTGAGIFCEAQGGGGEMSPLCRNLVHHNKAFQTLLWAWDWGGIETNGAPFMNYDNVSGEPRGMMFGFDGSKKPAPSVGMAYYWDHGHDIYGFNLIAYGATDDWKSKVMACAGLYEASATTENHLFNSTIYRVWLGSLWSPVAGRHAVLGTIFDDIGGMVFHHGPLKEDTATANVYPHASMAYGRNVFSRTPQSVEKAADGSTSEAFATYEATGTAYGSLEAMAKSFAAHPALASDVGVMAKEPPMRDPANGDFRPSPGSAASGRGVKMFVPWTLAQTVAEWHFRRDNADPSILLDDHFCNVPYMTGENQYSLPVFNLVGHGISAKDFGPGPLEDWCDSALSFDGRLQYASLTQAEIGKPFTWDAGNKQKRTAQGRGIVSPDVDRSSLLIEAYLRAQRPGGVVVAKLAGSGYQLALNRAGGVTFTLLAGGEKAELASGARIVDGKWHHVVAEFDRAHGSGAIYTDGITTADGNLALPKDASLANDGDLLVGKGPNGAFFAGSMEFLRIARTTLAESKTSIEELYDWEFDGPFLRDFAGREPTGKGRDAGALEGEP